MQKFFDYFSELEFFVKIAISCVIFQWFFAVLLQHLETDLVTNVLLYWFVSLTSFYGIGYVIEQVIKKNDAWKKKLTTRVAEVKKQTYPAFTLKEIFVSSVQGLIASFIILYLAQEVESSDNWLLNLGWFFMSITMADFLFYVVHRVLHQKRFIKIHRKHHEFRDTSSFVAGHKSLLEYCITTIIDLLPIFIFGYDINQLLAWTLISNAYNLEGHSSLSIFFIQSDFHDLHHTHFVGNYGIQGFWDRIFNTLNHPTKKYGLNFPINFLEAKMTTHVMLSNK